MSFFNIKIDFDFTLIKAKKEKYNLANFLQNKWSNTLIMHAKFVFHTSKNDCIVKQIILRVVQC